MMAKTNKKTPIINYDEVIEDNIIEDVQEIAPIELDPIKEETPTLIKEQKSTLKLGYVFAKLKSGNGGIIQVPEKNVGTVYKDDVWEFLEDKKK